MTEEKLETLGDDYHSETIRSRRTIQPNIRQKLLEQARIRVENLGPSPLERIKAMCQEAEFDCSEAEGGAVSRGDDGSMCYWRGRIDGFRAVLNLIRELEQ